MSSKIMPRNPKTTYTLMDQAKLEEHAPTVPESNVRKLFLKDYPVSLEIERHENQYGLSHSRKISQDNLTTRCRSLNDHLFARQVPLGRLDLAMALFSLALDT